MMNLAQIDLFRAVVRYGGMTKAATALGVGQPYVSRAIAQLEADIGFSLFTRGRGSSQPTLEGEAFAREVDKVCVGMDHLRHIATQIREVGAAPICIACQPSLAPRLLPRAVRRFSAAHPCSQISIHVPTPDSIWSWTSSGQCDVGLVRPRAGYTGVHSEPFLVVDAVCAVHREDPLSRKSVIDIGDLAGEHLIKGMPSVFRQDVDDYLASAAVFPTSVITAQYTAARCGLVAEGVGVTIVDPIAARDMVGLPIVLRPLRPRLPIKTVLIRPLAGKSSALVEEFIASLLLERDRLVIEIGGDSRDPRRSRRGSA